MQQEQRIVYDDTTTRRFIMASVIFGIVGMLVGGLAAAQLAWWQVNFGVPYTTFSRIRPLHTNAVIFAFVGNMMFAGVYYSTQRLLKTRMASDAMSKIHFWGWQLIIVAAAITLPLGITTSKEYAELEWPIDIAIAVIWIVFAINFFWTIAKRNEKNLYVAIWFYIATVVTIAVLHVVNSLALPLSPLKSYSVYAGVQDALVQWWYGHNAVAFFLTTPILGIMYYFLPKAAGRPVYSYRLSIIHFWALVFMYIWAGPHHLLYTALPDWAQSLGMVFSIALWAPSWGGMINGLFTVRGAWKTLREDPVIKFFIAAVTSYGMATFEGPLLSIKSVNGLAHYTDWIIGHAHGGALGWNGFMAAGMFYWLVPRLFGTKLYSKKAADLHFWIGTLGIILYVVSLWIAGITQGLMWRATNPDGSLQYPSFVETLLAIRWLYVGRLLGGLLFLGGFGIMAWNLAKTALAGKAVDGETTVVVETKETVEGSPSWVRLVSRPAILAIVAAVVITLGLGWASPIRAVMLILALIAIGEFAFISVKYSRQDGRAAWHPFIEKRGLLFTTLMLIAVLVGGVAELVPTLFVKRAVPALGESQQPYTALELEGRDIYLREGCYTCHSQMIRPMLAEKARYGAPSRPEEFIYDHPFQWGSKRTGPDLAREGGKRGSDWHYTHMIDPRATSPGSNMPSFDWLAKWKINPKGTSAKLALMAKLGVPYTRADIDNAEMSLLVQAAGIVGELDKQRIKADPTSEMVALIAYLQRLGKQPVQPKAELQANVQTPGGP